MYKKITYATDLFFRAIVLVEDTCPHLYSVVEIRKLALVALASRMAR